MTEGAFLRAIHAAPDDDVARLAFADWLEERGDARGELLRVATELEVLAISSPPARRERLARARRIGQLTRRWRELIRPDYQPWLAGLHRGSLQCSGVLSEDEEHAGDCPGRWDRLPPEEGRPCARHCQTCGRWVWLCWSRQQAERAVRSGRAVALAVVLAEA